MSFFLGCAECGAVHGVSNRPLTYAPWQCAVCFCYQTTIANVFLEQPKGVHIVDPAKDELRYALPHRGTFIFPVFLQDREFSDYSCEQCKKVHRLVRPKDSTAVLVPFEEVDT